MRPHMCTQINQSSNTNVVLRWPNCDSDENVRLCAVVPQHLSSVSIVFDSPAT